MQDSSDKAFDEKGTDFFRVENSTQEVKVADDINDAHKPTLVHTDESD